MNKCIVQDCVGTSQLVRFPRNKCKFKVWLNQVKHSRVLIVEDYHDFIWKYCRVCIDHFEPKYFKKISIFPKTLLPNAIPTLNMGNSSDTESDSDYIDIGSDFRTYFRDEYKYFKQLINPNFRPVLNKAVSRMPNISKNCVLQFDFLPIRMKIDNSFPTIGNTKALVFMLRGLFENWKQLLAYLFLDDVNTISIQIFAEYICDAIHSALSLNFNIVAVVCAPTSLNVDVMDLLSNNCNRIFHYPPENFEYIPFDTNRNIIILYDPPRLLTQLRREFIFMNILYKMDFKNYTASWKDIETVHEHRKQEKCQLLTDEHVYLRKMNQKSVHHAAQVFSEMVGDSLIEYAEQHPEKNLPTMKGTGKLLSFFNDLFDSVNGYEYKAPKHKPLYKKVSRSTDHYFFWQKSAKIIEHMYFAHWTGQRKTATLEKWQSTIYGIMKLWNSLIGLNFKTFVPRRINLDPLDNDLSRIRYHRYYVEDMKWNTSVLMKNEFYPDKEEFEAAFEYVLKNGTNFLTPLYSTFLAPLHSDRWDLNFENNPDEIQFNCLEDNCSSIVTLSSFANHELVIYNKIKQVKVKLFS